MQIFSVKTVVSKQFFFTGALGAFLLLLVVGCGKGVNLDARNTSYNFSMSGDLYVGDTIKFQSTAPSSSIFQWYFGDTNSSILPTPEHAYYSIAHNLAGEIISDTVTLIVDNDIHHAVVKTITLKPPVPRISKSWTWTGGYFKKYGNCCPTLSDHPLADATFSIDKIDDYTIMVLGSKLPFLADSNYFSNVKTTGVNNATYVVFTRDTLFYKQSTGVDTGGAVTTYYHKF